MRIPASNTAMSLALRLLLVWTGMENTEHYHGEGLHEMCLVVVECDPLLLLSESCKVKSTWKPASSE